MYKKVLPLLLLFFFPVYCFADGLQGVGEAFAMLAGIIIVIIALLNIAAVIISFRPPSMGRSFLLALAFLSAVAAVLICTWGIDQSLARIREETSWTTEIPEMEAERQHTLSDIRAGIATAVSVIILALALGYWYIRSLRGDHTKQVIAPPGES